MNRLYLISCLLLACMLSIASGCKRVERNSVLSIVTDATSYEKEKEYGVIYDAQGRIASYGHMVFSYGNNQINIKRLIEDNLYIFTSYSATMILSKGRVKEVLSTYVMRADMVEDEPVIKKQTHFDYVADTIFIDSYYRANMTNKLLKAVRRKCLLDSEKRVLEILTLSDGMNDSIFSCHNFYDYQDNIQYKSNLNLSAYLLGMKEPDEFFYFLLNVGEVVNATKLPNDITYNINKGEVLYQVAGNYHFQEDVPIRLELLKNEEQLLRRFNFEYLP